LFLFKNVKPLKLVVIIWTTSHFADNEFMGFLFLRRISNYIHTWIHGSLLTEKQCVFYKGQSWIVYILHM
jgi:hypothetical protein